MKIKITKENHDKIQAALDAVNGKSWEHVYRFAREIIELTDAAEKKVIALVGSKKNAVGAIYTATSGAAVANRYNYSRIGTTVKIERGATGWFLVDVNRATLYNHAGGQHITLTTAQDAGAVAALRTKYRVT